MKRTILAFAFTLLALMLPAFAAAQAATTQVRATDYFDPMNFMRQGVVGELTNYGTLTCPGGQPTGIMWQPCSAGSRIHFRNLAWKSRLESEDPLLRGDFFSEGNFSLDADYSGRMAGSLRIELDDGGVWEGIWTGEKSKVENAEEWILRIRVVCRGTGGNVDGMQLRFTEVATISTPLGFFWTGTVDGQVLIPASR